MEVTSKIRLCPEQAHCCLQPKKIGRALFYMFVLLLCCSCAQTTASRSIATEATTFQLFLQPLPQEAYRLSFTIGKMTARRADGTDIPLKVQHSIFSVDDARVGQKRLLSSSLPAGRYLGLSIQIVDASQKTEDGTAALLTPVDSVMVDYPFVIEEKQSQTLLLKLLSERLVTDGAFFTPKFHLWKAERMLTSLKGFVSNRDSASLTIFNKRTAQVSEALSIGQGPQDLVLDQLRGWLYVALADEDAIAVVEVNKGTILGRVQLRFGDEPVTLALTSNGDTLVALNRGTASVSIIDTASLFERGRVALSAQPDSLFVNPDGSRAYVTHSEISTLSAVDLNAQSIRFSASLDEAALDGVVSIDGQSIYLINDFSADLTVLDSASLRQEKKIFIGDGAISILLDKANNLLFVGMQDGTVAVVDPRALISIDSFSLGDGPVQDMAIDNEENTLFAVLPQLGQLAKVNLVSKQVLGRLELGISSRAVVVMGER